MSVKVGAWIAGLLAMVVGTVLSTSLSEGKCPGAFESLCGETKPLGPPSDGKAIEQVTGGVNYVATPGTLSLNPSGDSQTSAQLAAAVGPLVSQRVVAPAGARITVSYKLSGIELAGGSVRTVWASWSIARGSAATASCGPTQYRYHSAGALAERLAADLDKSIRLTDSKETPTCT